MHRFLANYFGHNIVDVQRYYNTNLIAEFGNKFGAHQLEVVNRNVDKEIAKNIDCFKVSDKNLDINLPEFKILTPEHMQRNGNFKIFNPSNSIFNAIVYRLEKGNSLAINNYNEYQIIGMHSWMLEEDGCIGKISVDQAQFQCGSIYIIAHKNTVVKSASKLNRFFELQAEPLIGEDLQVQFNYQKLPETEFYSMSISNHANSVSLLLRPYSLLFMQTKPKDEAV